MTTKKRKHSSSNTTDNVTSTTSEPATPALPNSIKPTLAQPGPLETKALTQNGKLVEPDLIRAIHVLKRQKGWSFADISRWLTEQGQPCNPNKAYRIWIKNQQLPLL